MERFQPPWLLLVLELLILAGLVVAAAGPRATAATVRVPVAVVLDDSFAMQAVGADGRTVRERAIEGLMDELEPGRHRVRLIAAGVEPRVIGDVIEREGALRSALAEWQPRGPRAEMEAAMVRAWEMVGESGRVMVATHRPPDDEQLGEAGRVRWLAFGEAGANVAIVNAWRGGGAGDGPGEAKVVLEVANFSERMAEAVVRIEQAGRSARRLGVSLEPGQTRRVRTDVTADVVHAVLEGDDALSIDDRAVLLNAKAAPVRTAIAIEDEAVREAVAGALEAIGRAEMVAAEEAELLLTDAGDASASTGADGAGEPGEQPRHVLHLVDEGGETGVLTGPFAIDTTHPLTEGLSLAGVLWSIGQGEGEDGADDDGAAGMGGRALVMAGNEVLLSAAERASGTRAAWLRWRRAGSNFADSPDWVILLDNLLRWRETTRPGAAVRNVTIGDRVTFRLPRGVDMLRSRSPGDRLREIAAPGGQATVTLDEVGVWRYAAGEGERRIEGEVAANATSRSTSDLRESATGAWGGWEDVRTVGRSYRDLTWLAILLLVGLLLIHGWLLRQRGGGA